MADDRDVAIDAVDALNDLIGDITTGTNLLRNFRQGHKANKVTLHQMIGVQKMCLSHLALAMSKLLEFWEHYHGVISSEHAPDVKILCKRIRAKNVQDFRNTSVGHIWNSELKRYVKHSEVMAQLAGIVGEDMDEFLKWLHNPDGNIYPNTVRSIVEAVRDDVAARFGISPEEVIDR